MPDTYFFVELIVNGISSTYGPYADFESAARIMMNLMPEVARLIANTRKYSYESMIHERVLHEEKQWDHIHTHVIVEKCYRKKNI